MIYPNADSALYLAESKTQDQIQRQKVARSDAGIDRRGVFARSSARILYVFGHQLVRLGRHLETYDLTAVTTVPQMQGPAIQALCD
ncbi:MAG: hypothetical protein GY759_13670 [Chloroflexi bacterium]|nr:hypothetical protein [Chloroflexota bacterium]